ncbi:MAG: hypothetical protein ACT4PY_13335 [Armatimonadota bacterium]
MKQTTVRGIDTALARRLREEARRRGLSLNRTVLLLLRQATGLATPSEPPPARPELFSDLDHLAGSWTKQDADEFDRAVQGLRGVDEDMWT